MLRIASNLDKSLNRSYQIVPKSLTYSIRDKFALQRHCIQQHRPWFHRTFRTLESFQSFELENRG